MDWIGLLYIERTSKCNVQLFAVYLFLAGQESKYASMKPFYLAIRLKAFKWNVPVEGFSTSL